MDINADHPVLKDKSLISWDIILCSMPAILTGNVVGLIANAIFPEWSILSIFLCVMLYSLLGCIKRYNQIIEKDVDRKPSLERKIILVQDCDVKDQEINYTKN